MADESFNLIRALRQVTSTLDGAGIPYALCGGVAVTSLDGLATMKRPAGRAQNLADLEKLGLG